MIVPLHNDCLEILSIKLNQTNKIGGNDQQQFKYPANQTLKHKVKQILCKLISYPKKKNPIVQFALLNSWGAYICSELVNYGAYEFKLHGNPWLEAGFDIETSRRLLEILLGELKINGWTGIYESTSIQDLDRTTMFFTRSLPDLHFSVSTIKIKHNSIIRVGRLPLELIEDIKKFIWVTWSSGIQSVLEIKSSFEFKLNLDDLGETADIVPLVNSILAFLQVRGWTPLSTINIINGAISRKIVTRPQLHHSLVHPLTTKSIFLYYDQSRDSTLTKGNAKAETISLLKSKFIGFYNPLCFSE